MAKDYIGYEQLTQNALRSVVREALRIVLKKGLIGSHHFYISFRTTFPGVEMPDFLREQYPGEITIVLQNQFTGLRVEDDSFDVTLSFQKVPAALHVPFAAVTQFVDPGVEFGLQFRGAADGKQPIGTLPAKAVPTPKSAKGAESRPEPKPGGGDTQVVSLDKFRKK